MKLAATGSALIAADWYYGHHHRGYGYYNFNPDPHCTYAGCCPRAFTVQGGVCKPYQGPRGRSPRRAHAWQ